MLMFVLERSVKGKAKSRNQRRAWSGSVLGSAGRWPVVAGSLPETRNDRAVGLMRDQNIISSLRLSWFRYNSACKLRHQHLRLVCRSDQRIDIAIIPFGNCALRLYEMHFL